MRIVVDGTPEAIQAFINAIEQLELSDAIDLIKIAESHEVSLTITT
ncbi:hypothetical protein [Vibrio harveyi]